MSNNYFRFKQFTIYQEHSVFKVGTDGVLLGACADMTGGKRILDVGTGTGLIAIMIAQRINVEIVAIEPERNSYKEACENVRNSEWHNRISVENVDFQKYSSEQTQKFDIVVTNPPYFKDSLKNPDKDKSATRHSDSLTASEILKGANQLLGPEGNLQIILPYAEGTLFIAEASQFEFYCNRIIKIKTVPNGKIIRLILKFERYKRPLLEKFLTIETGTRHRYTEEYKAVTKDFYLNF
jgi:tRNA1Val (adenine37-N6)-methyltransferase